MSVLWRNPPTAISAKTWGFSDVLYNGRPLKVTRRYGSHVIENVQFKIAYPAQRHSQTAAECAVRCARGETVPREIMLPTEIVDQKNVSGWDRPYEERICIEWSAAVRTRAPQ